MTTSPEARLLRFAAAHHGIFRLSDAAGLGVSAKQVQARVRRGLVERVGKGVYRVCGTPVSDAQAALCASWRAGAPAAQRTALAIHGLDRFPRRPEVVTRTHGAHEFEGVRVFRSEDLAEEDVTTVGVLPVTRVARTLLDVGRRVPPDRLEGLVHDAVHRRLTSFDELRSLHDRVARQGRTGCGPMGALLQDLDPTAPAAESFLEVRVLRAIRDAGLPEPVRQHPVVVGGEDFRLDVCYPVVHLFIEGDGFGVHGTRRSFERDRWRQNLLVVAGWTPLRFTWRHTVGGSVAVATMVGATLRRLGHPDLLR